MKNDVVELIYEAALDVSRWQQVVVELARATGSTGGQVLLWDTQVDGAAFSLVEGGASSPEVVNRLYGAHYGAIDPRREHALGLPVGAWMACHHVCDDRFVDGSEFYQDYFIPVVGGRYMCGTRLADQQGMHAMLAIARAPGSEPFDPVALRYLDLLTPHLTRAARLHLRIARLQGEVSERESLIHRLAVPTWIVAADGRIAFANAAAETSMRAEGAALVWQAGRLGTRLACDAARLAGAIDAAVSRSVGDSFAIGRGSEHPALCTLLPLSARSTLANPWQRPMAAVFLSRADEGARLERKALQDLFGLTPAEARLAIELAAGHALDDCAARFGVSMSTVRVQLQAVYQKLGVNRQAALTAMLQNLRPPVL